MRRVVITNVGIVSSLGNNAIQTWNSILQGNSGIQSYINDSIIKNTLPYNLSLIKNFDYKKYKVPHAQSRMNSFLASAAQEALNFDYNAYNPERIGISIGSMASNLSKISQYVDQSYQTNYSTINRLSMFQILTNIPCASLNVKYKFKGPQMTVSTACASGLSAVIQAYKWIKLNQADMAIAGGVQDVYNPITVNSSVRLQAMTTKQYSHPSQASRPFDKERSGFVLGEGAGILVLEQYESALKRNANILGQIIGYGYSSDGYHLVRPEQSGQGQMRSMRNAINMAQINPLEIDNFNVHATSTLAGDQVEARTIKQLLGSNASKPKISAYKSYIGHTFGAAGAIQLIQQIRLIQHEKQYCAKNIKSS